LPLPDPSAESVMIAPWPTLPTAWRDAGMESRIARMQELVRAVREVRNRYMVDPKTPLDVLGRCGPAGAQDFRRVAPFRIHVGGGRGEAGRAGAKPPQSAGHVHPDFEVYVSLRGLIDVAAEIKRLEKQLAEKKKHLNGTEAKLKNESFRSKAPPEVVQQQLDLVADLQAQIRVLEENLRDLRQA